MREAWKDHYRECDMYNPTRIMGKADLKIRTYSRHRALFQPTLVAIELVHSVVLNTSFHLHKLCKRPGGSCRSDYPHVLSTESQSAETAFGPQLECLS